MESREPRTDRQRSRSGTTAGIAGKSLDAASHIRDEVQERASVVLDSAREKSGNLQASLADKLDAGAEAIRGRVPIAQSRTEPGNRTANVGQALAGMFEESAMWLRENDVTDLRSLLGNQLRERPARTALIALGIGIMLGRRLRR